MNREASDDNGSRPMPQVGNNASIPYPWLVSRVLRRKWDYDAIAKMWTEQGKTMRQIAHAIGAYEENASNPFERIIKIIYRMHKGYVNASGEWVKLPRRQALNSVAPATDMT